MKLSQKTNLFLSDRITWAILLGVLAIWSYFSFHNWISDSEFWPVSLSGHWDQWRTQPSLIYKPLFHLSLTWIYSFDLTSVEHLRLAKSFYTAIGAFSFILFFLILKKHLSLEKSLCLVLIFLFSNLGFSQIGAIRSDFLSYFFVLLFFFIVPSLKSDQWLKFSFFSFVFTILLFLITPKSSFFGLLLFLWSISSLDSKVRFRFVLSYGWLIILSLAVIDKVILEGAVSRGSEGLISFVIRSYQAQKLEPFLNWNLAKYLKNDAHLWLILIGGLVWQIGFPIFKLRQVKIPNWHVLGLGVLLILFFHKPLLPFFVGSYWGLLFLSLIPFFKHLPLKYLTGALFFTLSALLIRFSSDYFYSNSIQFETINGIENYLKKIPDSVLFDGLVVAPRVPTLLSYVGPNEERSNGQILRQVTEKLPDLIAYTHRLNLLEPEISQLLKKEYVSVGIGYWLRKDRKDNAGLENLKPAMYVFGFFPNQEILDF